MTLSPARVSRRSPRSSAARPPRATCGPTPTRPGSRASSRRRALRRSRCSSTSASAAHPTTCPRRGPGRRCRSSPRASSATRMRSLQLQLLGADAVLLLLRDLDDRAAARLMAAARKLNLDTLVEAHTAAELDRAVNLGADPIGDQRPRPRDVPDRPRRPTRPRRRTLPRNRGRRRGERDRVASPGGRCGARWS